MSEASVVAKDDLIPKLGSLTLSEADATTLDSTPQYDDSSKIKNYSTSFNLINNDNKPDLRNIKYKTSTEHLNCPICQQPFMEPLTTICGHTFCKECIYECFRMSKSISSNETSGSCPLDRTPIDSTNINDLFPTPLIIINLIDDLKVYCLNHERGCDWVGHRWEVDHHVVAECGYTGVKCSGRRESKEDGDEIICTQIIERRYLADDRECVHKLFSCNFCNEMLTKISEDEHLSKECLFNYQTCDLCLNDMIPLKNLEKHEENCSKIGHLKCPANEIGCKWIGNNETSLEIHLQNTNCQLNQFLPSYKSFSEKIEYLTNENQFLQKQINKILDSIIQGKITNLGYNESIEEINKFSSIEDQDKLIYLNFELDRLKFEIDEKILPFINKNHQNERESILNNLINENFIMKEDLNLQRILINSLRKQLQFLLFTRNNPRLNNVSLHLDESSNEFFDIPSKSSSEERLNLKL